MGKNFILFLVIWAVTAAYFIIQTFDNIYELALSIAFAIIALISFVVLLHQKSDEVFYADLTLPMLILSIVTALGMLAIASVFSQIFTGEILNEQLLSVVANPTSVVTSFLSEILFTFAMVATAEELLKLAAYAELKSRYGIYVAVAVAVGSWAGYHAIQAYENIFLVIPAFINGVILIGLLEYSKEGKGGAILSVILAHGTYNSIIVLARYIANPTSKPLLPSEVNELDIALVFLTSLWLIFILLPILYKRKKK